MTQVRPVREGRTERAARILVVDDDPVMTSLAKQSLEGDGYTVMAHPRWDDAHHVVREQRADLVVLDLCFDPGEMGWRVIDRLRSDPATQDIPMILWSSSVHVLEARGAALVAEDGVYVLAKPLGLDALSLSVARVLKGSRTAPVVNDGAVASTGSDLTPRERDVARLVACGYSNKRIAAELVITQGTAANHVAHILSKLGLLNRAQLAVWAAEHGMLDRTPPETN